MTVLEALTEEELSLATILMDLSGLDIAEFAVVDEQPKDKCRCGHWMWDHTDDDEQICATEGCECQRFNGEIDGCFRAWPYQWTWWRDDSPLSVDCCGRSVGKTASVRVRALGFIFNYFDQEMMITGPEAIHVNLITDAIETMVLNCRLATEMVVGGRGGIKHRPFMMNLKTKSRIYGRIPQRDGKGLKGAHPTILEIDEGQDLPPAAWVEVTETLKRGIQGARWRVHGVTRGFRDKFYAISQPGSGWTVHRKVAMCRPNWTDKERREKISMYGGKDAPDYRRNVLGEHGDSASPIFTLAAIMANTSDADSHHSLVEYHHARVTGEMIKEILDGVHPDDSHVIDSMLGTLLNLPPGHRNGDYVSFWAGMDVGFTIHPSEILVFGETKPEKRNERSKLKLITRVTMRRVRNEHQSRVMLAVLDHYRPKALAMDRTGVGLPLYQEAQNLCAIRGDIDLLDRIEGFNFSSKVIVDFDEAQLEGLSLYATADDVAEKCGVKRPFIEASTDAMRVLMDDHRYQFPWDTNFIDQLQCATLEVVKTKVDEYGRRRTAAGEDHALDAARLATLAFDQQRITLLLDAIMRRRGNGPVLDVAGW